MAPPGRDVLAGRVEVDETHAGRAEKGVRGRRTHRKPLIAMVREEQGEGIGRMSPRHVNDASAKVRCRFRGKRSSEEVASTPLAGCAMSS